MPGSDSFIPGDPKMDNYLRARSVRLVFSGEDYFRTLSEMIRQAKECIHIQTYILSLDETGNSVVDELKRAAERGVRIFFLADAYGSKAITRKQIATIRGKGINFRLFSTFFSRESIYRGRRLHHKIVVCDRDSALIGGINIANKYHGSEKEIPWLDYAVFITGSPCLRLHEICESFFERKKLEPSPIVGRPDEHIKVRFVRNDFVKGHNQIHRSYRNTLYDASDSVTFVASYFLPGLRFRRALRNARKRGIRIRFILAGKSDLPLLFYAEKFLYPYFLHHGIELYEWKNSVMHAKAVLADKEWVSIGSYNLNPISHYLSIELNAEILDPDFSRSFHQHIHQIIANDCIRISQTSTYSGNWAARLRNSLLYYFFKSLFLLFISRRR